jgi:hypothetical protein
MPPCHLAVNERSRAGNRPSLKSIYFACTSGGAAQRGQLWQYRPAEHDKGSLTLVFESPGSAVLDSPDNICVTPSGAILFCEDDASSDNDTYPLAPGATNIDRLVPRRQHPVRQPSGHQRGRLGHDLRDRRPLEAGTSVSALCKRGGPPGPAPLRSYSAAREKLWCRAVRTNALSRRSQYSCLAVMSK